MDNGGDHIHTLKKASSILVFVWYIILWTICIIGCVTARKRYRLRPRSPLATSAPSAVPAVSIIRPLKGLDPNIFENIESTFTQEYPNFEILLSVADEDDPVLPLVRDLCSKYPHVPSRIIIGQEIVGVNPKVNNLVKPFKEASHDLVWVVDSGVQPSPGCLARSVDALVNPSPAETKSGKILGLIHHVPLVLSNPSAASHYLGSRLEEVFLNTTHAKMYISINALAVDSCVVGKSNMYRRSDIELLTGTMKPRGETSSEPTGLSVFGKFLAEDNMIAAALWHELDLRHSLSCDVVHNVIGDMPLSAYIQRRIRWIRVRKHMVLAATLLEPLTESFAFTFISSWALNFLFSVPWWLFVPVNIACWIWVDLDVYASLATQPLHPSRRYSFLLAWCLRELLAFPIWFVAVIGDEVEWRGIRYRVLHNGEVQKVSEGPARHRWSLFSQRKAEYTMLPGDIRS